KPKGEMRAFERTDFLPRHVRETRLPTHTGKKTVLVWELGRYEFHLRVRTAARTKRERSRHTKLRNGRVQPTMAHATRQTNWLFRGPKDYGFRLRVACRQRANDFRHASAYQSLPSGMPSVGRMADCHVVCERRALTSRTLPSAMQIKHTL